MGSASCMVFVKIDINAHICRVLTDQPHRPCLASKVVCAEQCPLVYISERRTSVLHRQEPLVNVRDGSYNPVAQSLDLHYCRWQWRCRHNRRRHRRCLRCSRALLAMSFAKVWTYVDVVREILSLVRLIDTWVDIEGNGDVIRVHERLPLSCAECMVLQPTFFFFLFRLASTSHVPGSRYGMFLTIFKLIHEDSVTLWLM